MADEPDAGPGDMAVVPAPEGILRLRAFTPARIGLGRVGTGLPTAASLTFALDHARARDAVHSALDFDGLAATLQGQGWSTVQVKSAARDRTEYLRRPDLGRTLAEADVRTLAALANGPVDVAIVAVDGLSATAVAENLAPLTQALRPLLAEAGLRVGPVVLVEQGRVAIGDRIGELLGARLVILLVGERPGLSAADSLGCYLTHAPRTGTMDSARNCISNIRTAGLPPAAAARQIIGLVADALRHGATGVRLNDLRAAAPRIEAE